MPSGCCGRSHGPQQALLDRLVAAGVPLPEGAQLWSPSGGGRGWRVVDRHGREPSPSIGSRFRVSECLAATVLVVEDGAVAPG